MTTLTQEQQAAVDSPGDILLVAGAGTGKTRTLVERCLAAIQNPARPVALERMLVVTFTEAAAMELRKRIRVRLEERLRSQADDPWLVEQVALIESARISTLHGFCLHLVRDHFHRVGIDPAATVSSEEQAALLARETMDNLLRRQYRGEVGNAETLQQLVLAHGRGWDGPVRRIILRLHRYARSLRDPSGWFDRERTRLDSAEPAHWHAWLVTGFDDWRREWREALADYGGPTAAACRGLLESLPDRIDRGGVAGVLTAIREVESTRGRGKDPARKALAVFFDEAAFLESVASTVDGTDPLQQDWTWSRGTLRELLDLARRFGEEFKAAKRAQASLDFADLEQFALELLWDRRTGHPTTLAEQIRRQFDLVFVDEYQDINEAQDTILRAIGREGASANRFLVGDVKQSIYRFRLADPRIFQGYMVHWAAGQEHQRVLHLTENFRSHELILDFVNRVFGALMQQGVGGVEYDRHQHLRFGAPEQRTALRAPVTGPPRVELHLLPIDESSAPDPELVEDELPPKAEREAEVIGRRLVQLRAEGFPVWDAPAQKLRPVCWRDMAILLRAPGGKAEGYAKVFERLGIPLQLARGGFFEATEITDLLSLLQVLDNPLQDLPLLAALRAPWAALSPDELVCVRLASRASYFWTALRRFHRMHRPRSETTAAKGVALPGTLSAAAWGKVDRFLVDYRVWRRRIRQEPLSACLENVLDETGYEAWLSTQARAAQRLANVQRLLTLTRQFDEFQRQGLFRFLRFVESQQTAGIDAEPPSPAGTDAVRFLSVHQSKGLEFPVVAVADLGKKFNLQDLNDAIILDQQFGVCAQVRPPHVVGRYPSLPYWLARRRQKRETLGEELRLLYVAMTRACDLLLLSGSLASTQLQKRWVESTHARPSIRRVLSAPCSLDWLAAVLPGLTGQANWSESGIGPGFIWQVHPRWDPTQPREKPETRPGPEERPPANEELTALERKLAWRYPFRTATVEPAKTSVSALRRRADAELEDDAVIWRPRQSPQTLSGVEVGAAHHLLLESVALSGAHDLAALKAEAQRLAGQGTVSRAQVDALDLEAIAGFWQSPVGMEIRARESDVHRELPFTARFGLAELVALDLLSGTSIGEENESSDEWVIVQGFVDLAVIGSDEVWVLDFKTDRIADAQSLVNAYGPQLRLYALALSRIYSRPVTRLWLHSLSARHSIPLAPPLPTW